MEVPKDKDNLTYAIGDVKFFIRAQATVEDKFEVDSTGTWNGQGKFVMSLNLFYRTLVERFVVGWDGVTSGGKAVPYSFAALLALPADATQDWVIKLGTFIASNTGILPAAPEEASKNG